MHETNPDLVGIKAAVRQLAVRLENEAKASSQWAALAKNRGVPEVAVRLENVVAAIEEALSQANAVPELLFEAQEETAGHTHFHD
ncbi:MAG TPA: hypothetical protein VIJ97_05665 [Candidatus Anoxymicrobiaceae bacterium]